MPLVLLTCDTCGDRVIIDAASIPDARRRAAAVEAWTYDDDRDTCPQHGTTGPDDTGPHPHPADPAGGRT